MRLRTTLLLAAVLLGGIGWYLFRPERLWVNKTVDEGFPQAGPAQPTAAASSQGAGPEPTGADAGSPAVLASGRFHGVVHEGTGVATVFQLPDGQRVLRFTEFKVSNGPDVHVYMVAADDAQDSKTVESAGFVSLGPIKGNQGDQNYVLPADLDLSKYRSVTVWCRRFSVNFATAPLSPVEA